MKTAQAAQTDETPDTIEYHGLIWIRSVRPELEYMTTSPEIGMFHVYQYQKNEYGNEGRWYWSVNFTKIKCELKFTHLKTDASGIVDTLELAMVACLTARGYWLDEIKALMSHLEIGDYATGFKDGQADIAKKVQEVLS